MFYSRVFKALQSAKVPYCVVGGLAVALHGALRGTVDLDLVVALDEKSLKKVEELLKKMGLQSRIPVSAEEIFQFKTEYIEKRNLVAWSFVNPRRPSEVVDLLLTENLSKIKIKKVKLETLSIPVASIDDLIRMKQKSNRPQDKEDIKALRHLQK